ncbi:unnamed protein product [Sphagnum jensenii]
MAGASYPYLQMTTGAEQEIAVLRSARLLFVQAISSYNSSSAACPGLFSFYCLLQRMILRVAATPVSQYPDVASRSLSTPLNGTFQSSRLAKLCSSLFMHPS